MCHRQAKLWLGCVVIVAVGLVTAPAWAVDRCTDPPAGLSAWWPGEGSGVDLVGGWHGALVGDTTFAAGEVGEAFSFDGSGDYVEVADADAAVLGSDPFTVAFWMNSTTTGSGVYLLGKSHPDGGQGWDIRLHLGQIMVVGVNGWAVNITSAAVIEADQWFHLAVASDGANVTLYIDGEVAGSCPRQAISTASNPLRFGWTTNYGGTAHSGELDEIQFFDRALSAAEIQVLRQSAPGGSCRPCAALPEGAVAWWRAEDNFDDAIGRLNGAPMGGVAFDGGLVGRTFGLDGNDDHVVLPRDAVWDFGTASISVTAWFQSGSAGYRNILRYDTGYRRPLVLGSAIRPRRQAAVSRLRHQRFDHGSHRERRVLRRRRLAPRDRGARCGRRRGPPLRGWRRSRDARNGSRCERGRPVERRAGDRCGSVVDRAARSSPSPAPSTRWQSSTGH